MYHHEKLMIIFISLTITKFPLLPCDNKFTSKLDIITPKNIPNKTMTAPPRTGYGIVTKMAENFPNIPKRM
jgi:hypothetical protein